MFTGIVTDIGRLLSARGGDPRRLVIACASEPHSIALGASIAVDGICLTVVDKGADAPAPHRAWFAVEISQETAGRTTAGSWQPGRRVNLERALKLGDELGGHIVTGHVDATGKVLAVEPGENAYCVQISAPKRLAPYLAEKGSIAVDGVSLTVNEVTDRDRDVVFAVNLIPYTRQHTTLGAAEPGQAVNLEIDPLARYIARWRSLEQRGADR